MPTSLTVGKARIFSIVLHNQDGSVNATAAPIVASGNSTTMKATLNPSNPREAAVVGVSSTFGAGVNVNVSAPVGPGGATRTGSATLVINASPTDLSDVQLGDFGPEIDPPSWA